jgi:spore coat protein A, manganese oxidase
VRISRRGFLQRGGLLSAALWGQHLNPHSKPVVVRPALDPNSLAPFVDPLPVPPVARSAGYRPSPADPSVKLPYYRIEMQEFHARVHRDLPPTRFWGFGNLSPGPTFETRSGQGLLVEWANELPGQHFLPIDHTIHGAEKEKPDVRSVIHLHGAKVPPDSDGYPEDWYQPGKSRVYFYPNRQDAAMLWYHDHALGINRLNVYAGLLGAFIIRDSIEDSLHLPGGKYEIPLILCDRLLYPDGQLNYPASANPDSPWLPEVFGNAFLVNGALLPYLDVEPRKYRFRVLNASNGRFYHLSLSNCQTFHQIGTDQGLLTAPAELSILQLAPGERADIVADFAGHANEKMVLKNDTLGVMQIRVGPRAADDSAPLPATLRPVTRLEESEAVRTRELSLDEVKDFYGNSYIMLLNGTHWNMPVTEKPVENTVEIWNLVNTTDDTHPIHLHLVRFQILDRRPIENFAYLTARTLKYRGPAVPPTPGEAGWKDTVQAYPGMATRIIARFEGYTGRYVWHCHVLEHEDNEMMRPYEVVAAP